MALVVQGEVIAETDRVVLRPWRVEDADPLRSGINTRNHDAVAGGSPSFDVGVDWLANGAGDG